MTLLTTPLVFEAQAQPLMLASLGGWGLGFWEETPSSQLLLEGNARPEGYGHGLTTSHRATTLGG